MEKDTTKIILETIATINKIQTDLIARTDKLEASFARLVVLTNNIRACVDTQINIFEDKIN